MGRQKLVDKFRVDNEKDKDKEDLSLQVRFQRYLEKKTEMVANYVRVRWGVKPRGYFNAIELSTVETSWGVHYILNIIVPHDIEKYYKFERALVKYAYSIYPIPEFVSIKVYDAKQLNQDADMISIEAKVVMVGILN